MVVKMKAAKTRTLMDAHVPYEAFWEGFIDDQHGQHQNPAKRLPSVLRPSADKEQRP